MIGRIGFPPRTRLAGFGNATVYAVRLDEDDLQHLERWTLPYDTRLWGDRPLIPAPLDCALGDRVGCRDCLTGLRAAWRHTARPLDPSRSRREAIPRLR